MNKLGIGSLYPTLKRMEKAKLIQGEFRKPIAGEDSSRRKYYQLLIQDLRKDTKYRIEQLNQFHN